MSSSDSHNNGLRHPRIWWLLGACIVAAVLVLSLMDSPPQIGGVSDKWQHAFAYAVLMSWFAQLSPRRGWIAIALVAMGIAVEYLQLWGGVRHFEVLDMLADAAGVAVGWLLHRLGVDYLSWFEA